MEKKLFDVFSVDLPVLEEKMAAVKVAIYENNQLLLEEVGCDSNKEKGAILARLEWLKWTSGIKTKQN